MKTESIVNKITHVHATLVKKKSFRLVGLIHSIVAYLCLVVVLLTGGLFMYETQLSNDERVNLLSVVSSKAEYADGEFIKFLVVADINQTEPITLNTVIRCDSHDGGGISYVGVDKYVMKANFHSSSRKVLTNTSVFLSSVGESANFKVRAAGVRDIIGDEQLPVPYHGALPTALVSTCYGEHTFSTTSPIFGLSNEQTINSYPFEYVWYNYFGDNK
jgi:hypothetical protein